MSSSSSVLNYFGFKCKQNLTYLVEYRISHFLLTLSEIEDYFALFCVLVDDSKIRESEQIAAWLYFTTFKTEDEEIHEPIAASLPPPRSQLVQRILKLAGSACVMVYCF